MVLVMEKLSAHRLYGHLGMGGRVACGNTNIFTRPETGSQKHNCHLLQTSTMSYKKQTNTLDKTKKLQEFSYTKYKLEW